MAKAAKNKQDDVIDGSKPLANTRHEEFCKQYILNRNASEACRVVYPKTRKWADKAVWSRAYKLMILGDVMVRIEYLQQEAANRFNTTLDEVLTELVKLGFSNMQDYVTFDEDGKPDIDLSKVSREKLASVQEIVVEDIVSGPRQGVRTKLKLSDKRQALVKIGEHLGGFQQKISVSGPVQISISSDDEQL